jgi:hypothetical protein
MKRKEGRAGVVSLPVLDLRREPDHGAELASQLLLGEVADVIGSAAQGRWLRLRGWADGYAGWARAWGLVITPAARARRWLARARHEVRELRTEARTAPGSSGVVSPLLWRSRVIRRASRRGHAQIELPDGRLGWVPARALEHVGARGVGVLMRIQSLIGTPYLWGGRSSMAVDCSGFTQLTLAEAGISIPRDARDQWRSCAEIPRSDAARLGDLVFFGSAERGEAHVGLYLGDGYYVHSRGRVGVNSLDPDNVLCDNELLQQFRGIGRPRRSVRARPGKSP